MKMSTMSTPWRYDDAMTTQSDPDQSTKGNFQAGSALNTSNIEHRRCQELDEQPDMDEVASSGWHQEVQRHRGNAMIGENQSQLTRGKQIGDEPLTRISFLPRKF